MQRIKIKGMLRQMHDIPMKAVLYYQKHEIGEPFIIKLKVPTASEIMKDDNKHYTRSNINVCYAAPRTGKPRDWYETQLCVSKAVRMSDGYPYKGLPFYAVTDDGQAFLAHTTSANNKQFAAIGDELILGRWLKGRLVADKLISPVSDTSKDTSRSGMITKEILDKYGANAIAFQKTDVFITDPEDPINKYEVWTLKMIKEAE